MESQVHFRSRIYSIVAEMGYLRLNDVDSVTP